MLELIPLSSEDSRKVGELERDKFSGESVTSYYPWSNTYNGYYHHFDLHQNLARRLSAWSSTGGPIYERLLDEFRSSSISQDRLAIFAEFFGSTDFVKVGKQAFGHPLIASLMEPLMNSKPSENYFPEGLEFSLEMLPYLSHSNKYVVCKVGATKMIGAEIWAKVTALLASKEYGEQAKQALIDSAYKDDYGPGNWVNWETVLNGGKLTDDIMHWKAYQIASNFNILSAVMSVESDAQELVKGILSECYEENQYKLLESRFDVNAFLIQNYPPLGADSADEMRLTS